jgi:DNA-binding LytR/AlgR family response regulator
MFYKEDVAMAIVVFDDELESSTILRQMVDGLLSQEMNYDIIEINDLSSLARFLKDGNRVDILVTDIVMPESSVDGIEVVKRLFPAESGTQVIYVSGYIDQSLEVYPSNHLYFLLKPVDEDRLREALSLALAALNRRRPTMVCIKVGRREQLINTSTITYLSSDLRKVTVNCRDATKHETYARLDELQPQLPVNSVRCHRSYIVNLAFISSLDERMLTLVDGTQIPVSRRRVKEVQRALLERISGRSQERG